MHDNFFELGGHSLLATQVVARARERFDVELALPDILAEPTVANLAAQIERSRRDREERERMDAILGEVEALSAEEARDGFAGERGARGGPERDPAI